jgi:hypothetical protein
MTGKCELCERRQVQHAHRQALSKLELQGSRRLERSPSIHPGKAWCCSYVLKATPYFGVWHVKLHQKKCLIFINYPQKKSFTNSEEGILLEYFLLWQTWCRGVGSKGFCPGQMVKYKNSANCRNNLKKGSDVLELIWGSQNKWLLLFSWENVITFLFFTKEIADVIDQREQ